MLSLITPENLPATLTAVGGLIGGGGIITWFRIRREPPKIGSPDAATLALAENTQALRIMAEAMKAQNTHFADNNDMFRAMGPMVAQLGRDFAEVRHDTADVKANTGAIRDALNRRP